MLETVRADGREQLADRGVADEVRERHAHHIAATIEAAVVAEMSRLVPELVPALDWCIRAWSQAIRLTAIRGAVQEQIVNAVAIRLEEATLPADGTLDVLDRHERDHLLVCRHGEEAVPILRPRWSSSRTKSP